MMAPGEDAVPITPVPLPSFFPTLPTATTATKRPSTSASATPPWTKVADQSLVASINTGSKKRRAEEQPEQAPDAKRQSAGATPETTSPTAEDARNTPSMSTSSSMTPYSVWKDAYGRTESAHGALIPVGYQKSDNLACPWPCPVGTCSLSYKTLEVLGTHFSNDHRGLFLRDTLRGTWEVTARKARGLEDSPSTVVPHATPELSTVASPQSGLGTMPALDYIERFIPLTPQLRTAPLLSVLSSQQAKRELPWAWIAVFGNRKDIPVKAMLATLVYLTGDSLAECCAECKKGNRPTSLGKSCIVQRDTVYDLSMNDKALSAACAPCILYAGIARQKLRCSLISKEQPSVSSANQSPAGESPTVLPSTEDTPSRTVSLYASDGQYSGGNRTALRSNGRRAFESPAGESTGRGEIWETAPGRATVNLGNDTKTIAFSASYLKSTYPLTIDNSLLANNIELGAGKKHVWDAKDDRTRLCTMIRGKLCVRVAGSSIVIREGGIFKVPLNVTCEVENVGSFEAIVSVITALEPGAIPWEKEAQDSDDDC